MDDGINYVVNVKASVSKEEITWHYFVQKFTFSVMCLLLKRPPQDPYRYEIVPRGVMPIKKISVFLMFVQRLCLSSGSSFNKNLKTITDHSTFLPKMFLKQDRNCFFLRDSLSGQRTNDFILTYITSILSKNILEIVDFETPNW